MFRCQSRNDAEPLLGAVEDQSVNPNEEEARPSIIH